MFAADPVKFGRVRWVAFAALLVVLVTSPARAAEQRLSAEDAAVLRRVDAHYNHLRSLRTHFTESYDGMGLHRNESGSLLLSKPGKMRWDYSEPRGKTFVMDGHYGWSYVPGDAQAQRISAKQMDDLRSPLRLLLGHAQLRRELVDIAVTPDASGGAVIVGGPIVPGVGFTKLMLRVLGDGSIKELTASEVDGATTKFTFTDTQDNVPTSDADFVFAPPMGVPIVDGLPPI